MTDSELQQAMDRLRSFNFAAIGTDHCSDETLEAVEAVCHAYLAEHPADDDEPITDEWLKDEWGFYGNSQDNILQRWVTDYVKLYRLNCFANVRVMYSGGHNYCVNRGEVRRLAKALGLMRNPHRKNQS